MISPLPWTIDESDPSVIYDADGEAIAKDYKFLHVDDFEAICELVREYKGRLLWDWGDEDEHSRKLQKEKI